MAPFIHILKKKKGHWNVISGVSKSRKAFLRYVTSLPWHSWVRTIHANQTGKKNSTHGKYVFCERVPLHSLPDNTTFLKVKKSLQLFGSIKSWSMKILLIFNHIHDWQWMLAKTWLCNIRAQLHQSAGVWDFSHENPGHVPRARTAAIQFTLARQLTF